MTSVSADADVTARNRKGVIHFIVILLGYPFIEVMVGLGTVVDVMTPEAGGVMHVHLIGGVPSMVRVIDLDHRHSEVANAVVSQQRVIEW